MTKEQEEQFTKQWQEINKKIDFESIVLKNKILKERPWLFDYREDYEMLRVDIERLKSIGTLYIDKYPFSAKALVYHIHSLCYAINLCIYLFLQRYSKKAWGCGDQVIKDEFNYRFQIFIEFWNSDKHYDKQIKYKLKNHNLYRISLRNKVISYLKEEIKNDQGWDEMLRKWDFIQQDLYIDQLKDESKDKKYWFENNKYLNCKDKTSFYKAQDKVPLFINHFSLYKSLMDLLDEGKIKACLKEYFKSISELRQRDFVFRSWKKYTKQVDNTLTEIWSFFVNSTKLMDTIKNTLKEYIKKK